MEIGRRIGASSRTCHSCHGTEEIKDAAVLELKGLARTGEGIEVLRHFSVIENEPTCSTAACHAHPADQRGLGVLDLEMSMEPLEAAVRTAQKQLLWTTIILIFIVGVISAVFIRRVVHRPVVQLYQGTRRIADGDLDTRIQVSGHHELAWLADSFNQMAGDLNAARQEVTEWSQKLEDKVVEKTEELGQVQRQILHMEKMASLGKLSATVAHELNNPLSGMLTYARLVRRELASQPIDTGTRDELSRYLSLIEKECSRCHQPFESHAQEMLCVVCHEDVDADVRTGQGFHGHAPGISSAACRSCHSEHLGREADIVGLVEETFDHALTDYALEGAHRQANRLKRESKCVRGRSFPKTKLAVTSMFSYLLFISPILEKASPTFSAERGFFSEDNVAGSADSRPMFR